MFKIFQPFGLLAGSVTPSHTSRLVDVSFPLSQIKCHVYKLLVLVIVTQSIAICITVQWEEAKCKDGGEESGWQGERAAMVLVWV